jgi:hypothetical protein
VNAAQPPPAPPPPAPPPDRYRSTRKDMLQTLFVTIKFCRGRDKI